MRRHLPAVCAVLLYSIGFLHAQNVFNNSDAVISYDKNAVAGSAANPNQPGPGVMADWVRTSRVGWNSSNFKCYIWNGMAFRLRFPNNYNPANASKYPVIVFFHGGGETGTVYDNEYHLLWGAQLFEQRINNGEWNGFLLFPQETSVGWDDSYFSRINGVLDTLQRYNRADPDRVITMGLSSGGYGAVAYASTYPQRVAASLASSPAQVRTLGGTIPGFVHVPVWIANGGVDVNPDPYNAQAFYADFRNAGGNIYQSYYVNNAHNTWTDMWNQKNASGVYITTSYWNSAHKAQPLLYYQNQQFCGSPIAARMGISAGFYAYQWQQNNADIPGANGNEYTARAVGSYRVRFMRHPGGEWSDWSPNPVLIANKSCAADTLFAEHFNSDNYFVANSEYSIGNFPCQNGIVTSGTDAITQDATGTQGGRFLINYTGTGGNCTPIAGDLVWKTYTPVTVNPNTNYEYSFYMGNQTAGSPAQLAPSINGTPLTAGYVQATGTGNGSWKQYVYTWNSGSFTFADLGIINRAIATTGNDFVIDEIAFRLASASPVPGCTSIISPLNGAVVSGSSTAGLSWAAAANAASYDVYLWTGGTAPGSPVATLVATSYNATGLNANSQYRWYVVPKNSNGVAASGCSNNQASFTTAATPQAPACAAIISPADGSTVAGSTTATLQWTAAASATGYDVYLWKGSTAPVSATASVSGTSYNGTAFTASTDYHWYVVPKNAVGSASGCNLNPSDFRTAAAPVTVGNGTGLRGDYYNTMGLTGSVSLSRTDGQVDFNWGSGSPYRSIDANTFSVRWTGYVQPQYSQTYTFYTRSDDGVRLWINGQQIINNWTAHSLTENSGSIQLTAGVKYSIRLEYYENTGDAALQLLWSAPLVAKTIIPQKQLYTPGNGNRVAAENARGMETGLFSEPDMSLEPALPVAGLYPNPVLKGQSASLQLKSENGGPALVQVAGIAGNIVQTYPLNLVPGTNIRSINTSVLPPGLYLVRVSGNAVSPATLKLVVQ